MKRVLFVLLLATSLASAQQYSRFELATGYSYASLDSGAATNRLNAQGWLASVGANIKPWVALEADVSGQYNTQPLFLQAATFNLNSGFYSFLAGPKISYRHGRIVPFVHGLVGVNRVLAYDQATVNSTDFTVAVPYQNTLGAAVGGGVDYAISKRVAFRSQFDYFVTGSSNGALPQQHNNVRLMAGIVFAFGDTTPDFNTRKTAPVPVPTPADASNATYASNPAEEAPVAVASSTKEFQPPNITATGPSYKVADSSANTVPVSENVPPTWNTPIAATPTPAASPVPAASADAAPSSEDVVVLASQAAMREGGQQQVSLGEIARRYREQKANRLK